MPLIITPFPFPQGERCSHHSCSSSESSQNNSLSKAPSPVGEVPIAMGGKGCLLQITTGVPNRCFKYHVNRTEFHFLCPGPYLI